MTELLPISILSPLCGGGGDEGFGHLSLLGQAPSNGPADVTVSRPVDPDGRAGSFRPAVGDEQAAPELVELHRRGPVDPAARIPREQSLKPDRCDTVKSRRARTNASAIGFVGRIDAARRLCGPRRELPAAAIGHYATLSSGSARQCSGKVPWLRRSRMTGSISCRLNSLTNKSGGSKYALRSSSVEACSPWTTGITSLLPRPVMYD